MHINGHSKERIEKWLILAVEAAVHAGEEILNVYQSDFEVYFKADNSPLTQADKKANAVILAALSHTGVPIISEESEQEAFHHRKQWEFCWLVDPLDGTKEFVNKNDEFTVNIALCQHGKPLLGVIYIPATAELYYGDVLAKKAFKTQLIDTHELADQLSREEDRISPSYPSNGRLKVVGSKSFMTQNTLDYIDSLKEDFPKVEFLPTGSSIKFCLLAEGAAHVYPRFGPSMEWDTAAGQAICNAVGLVVRNPQTSGELRYNKENLLNPSFVVHHP